jgi:selenocysteine-specific elongation factor
LTRPAGFASIPSLAHRATVRTLPRAGLMRMKNVIVGTAGHIDHGKSTLVEALTGTHPDRLEEEKRRGITIDLGFAFLELGDVRLGFVDVPGHERFVRNMLAGVGGIDVVLLVVAADESLKPQTREHFEICRLLEIPRGLVALTKADLVDADMCGLVRLEVEEFVRGSFLEGAPVVAVSARTGLGLDRLRQELRQVAEQVPGKDAARQFRLPVDRAFAMKGFGTVVTGTLISGSVKPEDEVELLPAQRRVRVRGVHSGGKAVNRAFAGQRTAVNLAGVAVDELGRGMVLATPGQFEPTTRLDARITLLGSARAVKNHTRAHFHQGTAEAVAELVLLERNVLGPGEVGFAQLRLDQPVLVLPGDRFILRQFSPVTTIGGGVVLDSLAPRHRRRDAGVLPLLRILERGERGAILAALAAAELRGLTLAQVVARTGWTEAEVLETAAQLEQAGQLRQVNREPWVVASSEGMAALAKAVRDQIARFHQANPLVPGISKEDLRARVAEGARPEMFRAALDELVVKGEVTVAGDIIQRAGRAIALLPEEAKAKEQIEREFERAGLAVPHVAEVLAKLAIDPKRAQKLLSLLLREQVLVKVAEDLIFHRAAIARLRELLASQKQQHGPRLAIATFKELTGITRKYAIPLLEYMDRERVTRRAGDERIIL